MSAVIRSSGWCLYGPHEAEELWDGRCAQHLASEQRTRRLSRVREVRRLALGTLWLLRLALTLVFVAAFYGGLFGVPVIFALSRTGVI